MNEAHTTVSPTGLDPGTPMAKKAWSKRTDAITSRVVLARRILKHGDCAVERAFMNTHHCCEHSRSGTVSRHCLEIGGWLAPSVLLVLIPKCPTCFAVYIALGTGVGLSVSSATYLRAALLILCLASLLWVAVRRLGHCETLKPHALGAPREACATLHRVTQDSNHRREE